MQTRAHEIGRLVKPIAHVSHMAATLFVVFRLIFRRFNTELSARIDVPCNAWLASSGDRLMNRLSNDPRTLKVKLFIGHHIKGSLETTPYFLLLFAA